MTINNKGKIVFINQWTGYLMKDVINVFAERYDSIALITGHISDLDKPLNEKVRIYRICKYNKKSILSRALTWCLGTIQALIYLKFRFRGYHIFYTSNPPIIAFTTLFLANKYSVLIYDIYPDALIAGRFLTKNSLLCKLWEKHNTKYFSGAQNIFTLTDGMAVTMSQYCNTEKIKVIYPWSSGYKTRLIDKSQNKFILANALENRFVVMYSGNIGLGHHVEKLLDIASQLKDHKEIIFLIIGEGWYKEKIKEGIESNNLFNCKLMPFQSSHMFEHSLQAADIGVVSISKDLASLCIPSKTFNLINKEIPILCISEGNSELATLITKYDIGKCFDPGQVIEMTKFIVTMREKKEMVKKYKKNLRECYQYFTPDNSLMFIESWKDQVLDKN